MGIGNLSRSHYQQLPDNVEDVQLHNPLLEPCRYGDSFFKDVYRYHQCGGFWASLLVEVVWFIKFGFIVFVGIELTVCTRWDVLADHQKPINEWSDAFTPPDKCWAALPLLPSLLFAGAVFAVVIQLIRCSHRLHRCWEIRQFCSNVLHLPQSATELGDITWSEIQKRLIKELPYAGKLDELVIYHRILRHENYLVAMVNQKVLPVRFDLSLFTPPWSYAYLPDGYLFNLKMLLFWTPWSPFSQENRLRPEYKDATRQQELTVYLSKLSYTLGILNLIFAPVILIAQALVFLCSTAQRFRFHPSSILGRRWSNYAHLYLRSYNELPHEFSVRIGQACESASKYLDCFISRNLLTLADATAFILGSASVAFFLLGLIHEQMMHLTGYWAILVLGGLAARICLSYIPDEQVVQSPEVLLRVVLSKIHHTDDQWIQNAATSRVYTEVSHLFHYRLVGAFEDILSPLITPFLLIFVLPNHMAEIVDFLRNYTVELRELGDVCSLATLDLALHNDPDFQFTHDSTHEPDAPSPEKQDHTLLPQTKPLTGGKMEISLVAFHQNNPCCVLPDASRSYLQSFKRELMKEVAAPPSPGMVGPDPLQIARLQERLSPIPPSLRLKNVSHLPGPGYINTETCGVVGALTESMTNSMRYSDPGVMFSTNVSLPVDSKTTSSGNANVIPDQVARPLFSTGHSMYQACHLADPLNTSLLLTCHKYTPYASQMENGSSQYWELANSAIHGQLGRSGLTPLLTADTSASILWLQELAHRRRLHQSVVSSDSQHPYVARSNDTNPTEPTSAFNPTPYQQPYSPNVPSTSSSRFKPTGAFAPVTPRFGYGAVGSTDTVGIVRTSVEGRRFQRPVVTDVVEEDDEVTVTPRGTPKAFPVHRGSGDSTPPSRSAAMPTAPTGVVTVSTSPALRAPIMQRPSGLVDDPEGIRIDSQDPDPDHIWPDLPPTNC